jgi:hypothetical protein
MELKNKEKKEKLGIPLSVGIIGSEGGFWVGKEKYD